jgi:M6 family metalloprotease-like protein
MKEKINKKTKIKILSICLLVILLLFAPFKICCSQEVTDPEKSILHQVSLKGGFPGIVPSPQVLDLYRKEGKQLPKLVDWVDVPQSNPVTGSRNTLTILIEFTDISGTTSPSDISLRIYGNSFGSMKHYYLTVSYGKLTIVGNLAKDGYYTEGHTMSYWGAPSGGWVDNYCIFELAKAAVALADADINFKAFDINNDNILQEDELSIIIVHAGQGEERSGNSNDIWSHRWVMFGEGYVFSGYPPPQDLIVDGVRVTRHPGEENVGGYTMQSEFSPMGVFAHEFGHSLGLPDLYDTDYTSDGVGIWCLMSYGTWLGDGSSPAFLSAWCRVKLGWAQPIELSSQYLYSIPIKAAEESFPEYSIYKFTRTSSATEYFLIEYRRKTSYDQYLPGEGILIWHIDDSKKSNVDENDRWVDLEEAHGGTQNLDIPNDGNYGDPQDPFYNQHKDEFTEVTDPNSKWKDNTNSSLRIVGISHVESELMYFDASLNADEGPMAGILNFDNYLGVMGSVSAERPSETLYFPHFHQGGGWRTYLMLVYPIQAGKGYPSSATVTINAYADDGTLLATKNINIPSLGKISGFIDSSVFFGPVVSNKKGWIEVLSNAPLVGLLNFDNYPTSTLMGSIAGMPEPKLILRFPHFHQGGGWRSYMTLVNPSSSLATVSIRAYSSTGSLFTEVVKTIPAKSKLKGFVDSTELLGSSVSGKKGWIEVVSNRPLVGLMNFDNYPTNTLMGSYTPRENKSQLVFPHVHQGGGWRTYLSIVNIDNIEVPIILMAFSEDGSLLATKNVTLLPKSKLEGFVNTIFPGLTGKGWITVFSQTSSLVGLLNFDNYPTLTMMGSLEPSEIMNHIEFPHYHMDSRWRTYVGFIRLGGKDYISLTRVGKIFDESGNVIGSTEPALLYGQSKWSGTISTLFGKTGKGWVAIRLTNNSYWD